MYSKGYLLLIGKRYDPKKKLGTIGGVVRLFEELLTTLKNDGIDHRVIDTNWRNYGSRLATLAYAWIMFLWRVRGCGSVSIHGSKNDLLFMVPFMLPICRMLGKAVSYRQFGGSADTILDNSSSLARFIMLWCYRHMDQLFFETKYLVVYFKTLNPKTYWLPNTRIRPPSQYYDRVGKFRKKFVFMGQIKRAKGVMEIVEAASNLPRGYAVDIYGPLFDGLTPGELNTGRAVYRGEIAPDAVMMTLAEYDVLVLPTYWKGEGYPGVIIEAYLAGLPVIATNLRGISEIVDHMNTGLLIKPRSADEITRACLAFTDELLETMRSNLKEYSVQFDNDKQVKLYLKRIAVG